MSVSSGVQSEEESSPTALKENSASFIRRNSSRNWGETGRTRLQKERQRINQQIAKEIEIRAGAERLFRATNSRKHHEKIAAELSVVNANLQILSEEIAELNSSVQVYQDQNAEMVSMIPLGLKETVDVDFNDWIREFLTGHYHVKDPDEFEEAAGEFASLRHACRAPTRDDDGVTMLYEYIHMLSLVERRFFTNDTPVKFQWYDSLTGIPSVQRAVAFEKASMLFNVGAIYTQIGARQRSQNVDGLAAASQFFERAAGIFDFIIGSFSNPPSMDLHPETLKMLTLLNLAQSQECVYELSLVRSKKMHLTHAQEAAEVCRRYGEVHSCFTANRNDFIKQYVPLSWISMVMVKIEYYKARSHFHIGVAYVDDYASIADVKSCLEETSRNGITPNQSRRSLARNHVRQATLLYEEAIRKHKMCSLLRKVDSLLNVLSAAHSRSMSFYERLEEEDNFTPAAEPPSIRPVTDRLALPISPNLSDIKVKDPFIELGPIHVFNAINSWSKPKVIKLRKSDPEASYGFSVRGSAPVSVTEVEAGSVAEAAGLRKGDIVIALDGENVRWELHEKLVERMRLKTTELSLTVVSPVVNEKKNLAAETMTLNRAELTKRRSSGFFSRGRRSS